MQNQIMGFPSNIINQIVSVQPMSKPNVLLKHYMKWVYGEGYEMIKFWKEAYENAKRSLYSRP